MCRVGTLRIQPVFNDALCHTLDMAAKNKAIPTSSQEDTAGDTESAHSIPLFNQAYHAQSFAFLALKVANQPVQTTAKPRHFSS